MRIDYIRALNGPNVYSYRPVLLMRLDLGELVERESKRDIPCRRDGTGNRIQLGYGKHLRYVQAAMTAQTSAIAVELAQDKDETKDRCNQSSIDIRAQKNNQEGES